MSAARLSATHRARAAARAAVLARGMLAMLAAGSCLAACPALVPRLRAPHFALTGIELRGGTLSHERLGLRLLASNPNRRSIAVRRIDFAVELAGSPVANGRSAAGFLLPAGGTSEIDVNVSADLRHLAGALLLGLGQRPIRYRIYGTVHLRPAILPALPFDARGTLH